MSAQTRPQKCYSWIWHFPSSLWWFMTLSHKGRWTEKLGEFCSRIIGPSLQHKWGKSLWRRRRCWRISEVVLVAFPGSFLLLSLFNWITGPQGLFLKHYGIVSTTEYLAPFFRCLFTSSLGTIFIWFSDSAELTFHLWFQIKLLRALALKSQ